MSTFGFIAPENIWSAHSEQYFNQVLAGIEESVAGAGYTVLTRAVASVEEEMAVYREWAAAGSVQAIVLHDLAEDDPRPGLATTLGLHHVLLGDVSQSSSAPSVLVDNAGSMKALLEELNALGHHRIAHLGGPTGLVHSRRRRQAYLEFCTEHGMRPLIAAGDYSSESGAHAVDDITPLPDVLIADNDAMAIGAIERAIELGIDVPESLSIVSWDDSMACQLHDPPVAALARSQRDTGAAVGRALLGLATDPPRRQNHLRPLPVLLRRDTLARSLAPSPDPFIVES